MMIDGKLVDRKFMMPTGGPRTAMRRTGRPKKAQPDPDLTDD